MLHAAQQTGGEALRCESRAHAGAKPCTQVAVGVTVLRQALALDCDRFT